MIFLSGPHPFKKIWSPDLFYPSFKQNLLFYDVLQKAAWDFGTTLLLVMVVSGRMLDRNTLGNTAVTETDDSDDQALNLRLKYEVSPL